MVVIQARTVLTLAEKVTATAWILRRGLALSLLSPIQPCTPQGRCFSWEEGAQGVKSCHLGRLVCTEHLCKGRFRQTLPMSHSFSRAGSYIVSVKLSSPSLTDLPGLLFELPSPTAHFLPTPRSTTWATVRAPAVGDGIFLANRDSSK